jgi:hypothetical protein
MCHDVRRLSVSSCLFRLHPPTFLSFLKKKKQKFTTKHKFTSLFLSLLFPSLYLHPTHPPTLSLDMIYELNTI